MPERRCLHEEKTFLDIIKIHTKRIQDHHHFTALILVGCEYEALYFSTDMVGRSLHGKLKKTSEKVVRARATVVYCCFSCRNHPHHHHYRMVVRSETGLMGLKSRALFL